MPIFQPKNIEINDYNERGKFLLVWRLSLILSFLFLTATLLTVRIDFYTSVLYAISLVICVFCFLWVHFTRQINVIFWIFTVSASTVVTFSMQTLIGTLHYPDLIWAACTIVFAYIGLGKRVGIVFLIFHVISIIVFFLYTLPFHLESLRPIPFAQQFSVLFETITSFFALTYLIHQYLQFQKHTEFQLKEANLNLEQKNKEISLLMKEIHHRIKNNLQLVISLLRMQKDEIDSEDAKIHFTEAINRILSISVIHQKLYQNEDLKNFNFDSYISDLVSEIQLMNQSATDVTIDINVDVKDIGLKTLVPMGLLLNELITNSFKHAFDKEKEAAVIDIKIDQCSIDKICLYYEDNGMWKENASKGFGLELVDMLTNQLEGIQEKKSSAYKFTLRNLDLE